MGYVSVVIYGADVIRTSCVNTPTSKDTYGWLQSLLKREYPDISFKYIYMDITKGSDNLIDHDLQFIERIEQDELFCPSVTMNGEYVADGYIQTKQITRLIDQRFVNE